MFINIIAQSKKTKEKLTTDEHGLFANININADGTFEIVELGTCVNNLSKITPDTEEIFLNTDDYEIVDIEIISRT